MADLEYLSNGIFSRDPISVPVRFVWALGLYEIVICLTCHKTGLVCNVGDGVDLYLVGSGKKNLREGLEFIKEIGQS